MAARIKAQNLKMMARIVSEQECKNCRFWRFDDDDVGDGYCQRRAPIAARADDYLDVIATTLKLLLWWTMREWSDEKTAEKQLRDYGLGNVEWVFHCTQWPHTSSDDWCGEWEATVIDSSSSSSLSVNTPAGEDDGGEQGTGGPA